MTAMLRPRVTAPPVLTSAISFAIAMSGLTVGIAYLPINSWMRAFLAIGLFYVVRTPLAYMGYTAPPPIEGLPTGLFKAPIFIAPADFADLAALDVRLPARDKSSVALLLACRPWVFSMFSAYRAKAAA